MGNMQSKADDMDLEQDQSAFQRFKVWWRGPWRNIGPWTEKGKRQLIKDINEIKFRVDVPTINCLMLGQVSSGKTSFCNTCATAIADKGRVLSPLTVYNQSNQSSTKKFESCKLIGRDGNTIKLKFFDCRGIHDVQSIHLQDICNIVNGNIKTGYELIPDEPISETSDFYREEPAFENKMHCVLYFVDMTSPKRALATKTAEKTFEKVREELSKTHVPQLVIMNKIDRLHKNFHEDLERVVYSNYVHSLMEFVGEFTCLDTRNVFVQSNYCDELSTVTQKDILTLSNIKTIMERVQDYFDYID